MNIRFRLFCIGLLGFLFVSCASKKPSISEKSNTPLNQTLSFGDYVQADFNLSPSLKNTLKDFLSLLEKSKQNEFPKIHLHKNQQEDFTYTLTQQLETASTESFYIKSENGEVWIYGRTDNAFSHGLYFYLEKMGFRFFMPGENWTIYPESVSHNLILDEVQIPSFRNRVIYGQGAFAKNPIDPENKREKDWMLWQRRNRLGQEFKLGGHSWHLFNIKNKDLLIRNPQYMAMVDGKRVAWYPNVKLNLGNPTVRRLFVEDRIEAYEKLLKQYGPDDYRAFGICVDPSDGGKHCESPESLALGSVSDRVFLLANEVAVALRKKHPKAWVYLYAYNMHAAVPNIKLEPNVYVQIVPYAFQRVASPEVLIQQWSEKCDRLGMYDYINLPDANLDQPANDWRQIDDKIDFWKKNNIESVLFESTNAKGPAGLALYLAAKLSWNHNLKEDELLNEFFEKSFDKGASPMREMLTRWANQYNGAFEIPLAIKNLEEASEQIESKMAMSRLLEYKSYVHYLNLFHKSQSAQGVSKTAAADDLLNYMWASYSNYMVHTPWIQYLYLNRLKTPSIKNDWSLKNVKNPKWRSIRPLSEEQIQNNFGQIKRENQVIYSVASTSDFATREIKTNNARARKQIEFEMDLPNQLIWEAQDNEFIHLHISGGIVKRKDKIPSLIYLSIINDLGEVVYSKDLSQLRLDQEINFTTRRAGKYHISFRVLNAKIKVKLNTDNRLAFTGKLQLTRFPERLYVFIGEQDDISYVPGNSKITFFDPMENKMEAKIYSTGLHQIKTTTRTKNKLWSFHSSFRNISFLNVPGPYYLN